jgi:DNA replication ATP-dependent helicase Dna2
VPLSPVDPNKSLIQKDTEKSTVGTDVSFCSSKSDTRAKLQYPPSGVAEVKTTETTHSSPQPNLDDETPVNTTVEERQTCQNQRIGASDQTLSESSHCHTGKREKHADDDEFGELDFSEDDLAEIDSLMQQPMLTHRTSKKPELPMIEELPIHQDDFIQNRNLPLTKTTSSVPGINEMNSKRIDKRKHTASIKESCDEFGDFPLDVDFAEIDAMVSSQSCVPNEEQSVRRKLAPLPPQAARSLERSKEREDEDEFGSFLNDDDFFRMDDLVATRCHSTESSDSRIREEHSMVASSSNEEKNVVASLEEKPPLSKTDDEFGDFTDDIDFDVLDQAVTENMVEQPRRRVDPNDVVQNPRRRGHNCGQPSFMQFSRYMVLSVDTDERNGTKTLRVATWVESMLENEELMKRILKDGKVKKSECRFDGVENCRNFTQVSDIDYPEHGLLYLCGEWSFTPVKSGDIIHVCSLAGQFKTDATALPIVLHSYPPPGSDIDDLILVLHPDMLMSPSIVSETASCNRRAALKSKIGSSGISSKAAFVGTMRHGLFEGCMKTGEFNLSFAQREVKKLIRAKAEMMIGCNISESEAEVEVLGVLPMIQQFAQEYTTLRKDRMMLSTLGKPVGGVACHPDIRLLVKGVHSVEENIVSTSLGLKGSIDAVLETESTTINHKQSPSTKRALCNSSDPSPQQSLMCLELKTGHNQSIQNAHMAQLSLYTSMLQSQYGAYVEPDDNIDIGSKTALRNEVTVGALGGILLYLNDKSQQICHVSPRMNEVKTLMSQRNVVASDSKRALRPRGISLCLEEADQENKEEYLLAKLLPAPTADLPELKGSSDSCKRCFSNRECMLYAASDSTGDSERHSDLMSKFTGHLNQEDLEYFRKWDRLIDIESESSNTKASMPWLANSRVRQTEPGESISEVMFDAHSSHKVGASNAMICFRINLKTCSQSSSENQNIATGSHVVVSADRTILHHFTNSAPSENQLQNRMHVAKGCIERIDDDKVFVSTTYDEMNQLTRIVRQYHDSAQRSTEGDSSESLLFRLDKSNNSFGTGTLRWNLINFLTSDYTMRTKAECTELDRIKQRRLAWLRDMIIRLKSPEFTNDPQPSLFRGIDLHIPGCNLSNLSKEFYLLNDAQQMAVKKVMSGRDYTLIQGLPGTGKTSTLGFLARLLVARGKRVLITAYTHSAVDNIMSKLIDKGMGSRDSKSGMSALVRLGSRRPCHESVRPIIHTKLALELDKIRENHNAVEEMTHGDDNHPSASSLKEVIATSRVVGVSALSLPRSPVLQSEIFDVVIIDEAGQMNEPTALGALAAADSFVLVGDHKQLPPLVNSSIADRGGYGISILKRLADQYPHAIAPLTMQYRMNEAICKISSESIYGGQMKCSNDKVRSQQLKLPGFPSSLPKPASERSTGWLHPIVDPEKPVIFVDTDTIKERSDIGQHQDGFVALEGRLGGSIVNKTEAKLVWYALEAMNLCGHDFSEIGVVSPFRAQIRVIEDNAAVATWKKKGLELSTIDKYQGRDKSTIILSLVRSNRKNNAGRLLQDARRLNVAFTRAKCKIIVIGSYRTLSNGSVPLKPILNRMDMRKQRLKLPDNAIDCYNIV